MYLTSLYLNCTVRWWTQCLIAAVSQWQRRHRVKDHREHTCDTAAWDDPSLTCSVAPKLFEDTITMNKTTWQNRQTNTCFALCRAVTFECGFDVMQMIHAYFRGENKRYLQQHVSGRQRSSMLRMCWSMIILVCVTGSSYRAFYYQQSKALHRFWQWLIDLFVVSISKHKLS